MKNNLTNQVSSGKKALDRSATNPKNRPHIKVGKSPDNDVDDYSHVGPSFPVAPVAPDGPMVPLFP